MSEILIVIVAIGGVFFLPLILAIMAMTRTARLQSSLDTLRLELHNLRRQVPPPTPKTDIQAGPVQAPPPPSVAPVPAPTPPASHPAGPPPISKPPPPPKPTEPEFSIFPEPIGTSEGRAGGGHSLEVALGGKVASFAGIAVLVMGIVFFVGYAIQHQWIGPGLRIILGLIAGSLLVAGGYLAETRGKNLKILARALTGGGAALFYFTVFAAHGMYNLITPFWAGMSLAASAAAVLALAVVYASQAVAVLGVMGAFIMPLLIGGDFTQGLFPLIFIAAVNIPVILLGLRRKWQWLYNLAFLFTVLLASMWLDKELPDSWPVGLLFASIFFMEFMALGLLKLKAEAETAGRILDIVRLLAASLALMGALYAILTEAKLDDWMGAAFLAAALLHVALAKIGWTWMPRFNRDILALLVGALTFATLALPVQLDGVWVSLGWAVEGVILAWFALRIRSRLLQVGAMALGFLGLIKSLSFDIALYEETPRLFLNGRFAVGMASAVLLGLQGWLHGAFKPAPDEVDGKARPVLVACALLAMLAVLFADAFTAMNAADPWPWLLTSVGMLAVGFGALCFRRDLLVERLGVLLLGLLPIKLVLCDMLFSWDRYGSLFEPFANPAIWAQLLILLIVWGWSVRAVGGSDPIGGFQVAHAIVVASLLAGIALVSAEIARIPGIWSMPLITLWWALCALTLAIVGLWRRRAYVRYLALFIFALTLFKVFTMDLEGLSGLQRIAAFIGVGLLLLALSFAYQKVAPLLLHATEGKPHV